MKSVRHSSVTIEVHNPLRQREMEIFWTAFIVYRRCKILSPQWVWTQCAKCKVSINEMRVAAEESYSKNWPHRLEWNVLSPQSILLYLYFRRREFRLQVEFLFLEWIILVLHKHIAHFTLVDYINSLFVHWKKFWSRNTEIALNAMWESDKFETLLRRAWIV